MKLRSIGIYAIAALLMVAGSASANDSETATMAKAMASMKQEMDQMRAEMSAQKESLRESAGGAPEALRSNANNATVRIGGSVIARYDLVLDTNNNDQGRGDMYTGGEYSTQNGWKMDTASITFDVQFNEDLSAFIDIRPSTFDKAYFQWNNIGGTGLGTQIGYIGIPGGMYSASWSPTNAVLIKNPVTKDISDVIGIGSVNNGAFDAGISNNDDLTEMGVKVYYEMDQFKITASVFNNPTLGSGATMDGLSGTNAANSVGDIRNGGISHTIMLEYSPAFLEGLHFSATYSGQVDSGQGTYQEATSRGTSYAPEFDLGIAYVGDKFSAWVTGDLAIAPMMYSDTWFYGISAGANYNVTEKFSVGIGADFTQIISGSDSVKQEFGMYNNLNEINKGYDFEAIAGRLQIGAKYEFCNGVWVRGTYAHTWYGANIEDRDMVRGKDEVVLETGVSF